MLSDAWLSWNLIDKLKKIWLLLYVSDIQFNHISVMHLFCGGMFDKKNLPLHAGPSLTILPSSFSIFLTDWSDLLDDTLTLTVCKPGLTSFYLTFRYIYIYPFVDYCDALSDQLASLRIMQKSFSRNIISDLKPVVHYNCVLLFYMVNSATVSFIILIFLSGSITNRNKEENYIVKDRVSLETIKMNLHLYSNGIFEILKIGLHRFPKIF